MWAKKLCEWQLEQLQGSGDAPKGFIRLKYGVTDTDIKSINQAFMKGFDHYLRFGLNCANNPVVKNIKNLGRIVLIVWKMNGDKKSIHEIKE